MLAALSAACLSAGPGFGEFNQDREKRGSMENACELLQKLANRDKESAEVELCRHSPATESQAVFFTERTGTAKIGDDCPMVLEYPVPEEDVAIELHAA